MDNLLKGTYWSLIIHAYVVGVLFFVSKIMTRLEPKPPPVGILLGGGGSAGGSPAGGGGAAGADGSPGGGGGRRGSASGSPPDTGAAAPVIRDVSEIIEPRPSRVTKSPSPPVRPAQPPPPVAPTQQSPTGPPLLAPAKPTPKEPVAKEARKPPPEPTAPVTPPVKTLAKKPPTEPTPSVAAAPTAKAGVRTKETEQERLERIRQGARPISTPGAKAAPGAVTSAAPISADAIRSRLLSGLRGTGGGADDGGGSGHGTGAGTGPSGGGGRGSGAGTGPSGGGGHGTGAGTGTSGGGGHGTGGGHGDGSGPGSGIGDPFYTAIGAALYAAWTPPSRADVGRGNPTVGVRITLRFDGTITAYQLSRPSGNTAMNTTVEALMRGLRRLPAPTSFGFTEQIKTIEVRFGLDSVGRD